MTIEFTKFLGSGIIAAMLNFGSRIVFSQWIGFVPAMILAFLVGLTTAFLLNRMFVFAPSEKHWLNEASWFVAINLGGLALTLGTAWTLARLVLPAMGQTLFVEETAHGIGIAAPILASYIGHKHLTFKRKT